VLAFFVVVDQDFSSPVDISLRLFSALVFTSLILGSSPSSHSLDAVFMAGA
jgi:hypothetical protein